MTVADIGTGTGYMLPFLSHAVGANGKVFGEDIAPIFWSARRPRQVAERRADPGHRNRSEAARRRRSISRWCWMCIIISIIPDKMLAAIRGRVEAAAAFGDCRLLQVGQPEPGHIRLERDEVAAEIEGNGFHLLAKRDHIPKTQYMLTFEKTK